MTGLTCPIVERNPDTEEREVCGRTTHQATALCRRHHDRLGTDLTDIDRVLRWIGDDPDGWLQRPVTDRDPVHVSRDGSPAPGRIDVISATDRRTLAMIAVHGWARDLAQTDRALDRVESARILLAHHHTIACHPALPEIADELHAAAGELRALCDEHWNTAEQDKKARPVGRCTQPHPDLAGRACGGDLHWLRDTLATRCARCGWLQEPDGWLPKRLILGPWGIERRTLDRWIQAGLVAYVNRLVCVDDVRRVVKTRRTTANG